MRDLLTPTAQISRVEFRALLTGSANRSRRRFGPDPPPCYGARRRNRSSSVSIKIRGRSCLVREWGRKGKFYPRLSRGFRSYIGLGTRRLPSIGHVAGGGRSGLQIRARRFVSGRGLQYYNADNEREKLKLAPRNGHFSYGRRDRFLQAISTVANE